MAAPKITHLAQAVSCHAFNADQSKVAICPNNPEIHIFQRQGDDWVLEQILKEHDQVVSGLDWGAKTNRIVSCSHDRNAYVWTQDGGGEWKPVLVILRIQRAATAVKWSPQENKFAVASGAKVVSVCYFEQENNWWISKHLKKHRSTVLSIDWHPNNLLIATGSCDFKCRIYGAAIKGVDKSNKSDFLTDKPLRTFGEVLAELDDCKGWVHSVAWNPGGNTLAFCGHDSRVCFVDATQGVPPPTHVLRLNGLPLVSLLFTDDSTLVGVGHEANPYVFKWGNGWELAAKMDSAEVDTAKKTGSAMTKFQNLEKVGQATNVTVLGTKHQNCISTLSWCGPGNIATSGVDGKLVIWPLP